MNKPGSILAAMMAAGERSEEMKQTLSPEMTARRLLDHYDQLATTHEFKVGQLVQLKSGFGTAYKYPGKGYPAVVTELLDPPFVDPSQNHCRPECQMKHDLRIGIIAGDGGFAEFVFPSRFLEPYTGKIET